MNEIEKLHKDFEIYINCGASCNELSNLKESTFKIINRINKKIMQIEAELRKRKQAKIYFK
jgi:hypothetical protein